MGRGARGTDAGSGTKEGFTGIERDAESGLDAFWVRTYFPALARWGSVDPMRDSFPEWNPYSYVNGNPVTDSDPFGLCPPELTGRPCLSPLRSPRGTEVSSLTIRSDANGDGAYGANRRSERGRYPHAGVDVSAPVGTAVTAVDVGEVMPICTEGCGSMGTLVTVGHRNAEGKLVSTSTYGHLSEVNPSLKEGFKAQGGTRLGRVGVTGNAARTDPHLHVELRDSGGSTQDAQTLLGVTRGRPQQ